MGILAAFFRGLGLAFRKGKVVIFLYVANLLFALFLAAPMIRLVNDEIGRSTAVSEMDAGFDARVAFDLLEGRAEAWRDLGEGFAYGALLYVLVATFLTGGILECLHNRNERAGLALFFLGCGRYVFRFLRLLLLGAIGVVVLAGANALVNHLLTGFFRGTSHERLVQILMWAKTGLFALLLLCLLVILAFARIRIVVEGRRSVLAALAAAIGFVVRYPFRCTGLTLLFLALGWAILAAGQGIGASALDPAELAGLLVLQQGVILLRVGVRVAGYGGQLELFKSLGVKHVEPPPIPAAVARPEPRAREPIPLVPAPMPPPPDVPAPLEPGDEGMRPRGPFAPPPKAGPPPEIPMPWETGGSGEIEGGKGKGR